MIDDPRIEELRRLLDGHPGVELTLNADQATALIVGLQLLSASPAVQQTPAGEFYVQFEQTLVEAVARGNPRITHLFRDAKIADMN